MNSIYQATLSGGGGGGWPGNEAMRRSFQSPAGPHFSPGALFILSISMTLHIYHVSASLPSRILGKPPEILAELQALAEKVRLFQQRLEEDEQAFEEVYDTKYSKCLLVEARLHNQEATRLYCS